MTKSEHTPGPWTVADDDPYEIRSEDYGSIGFVHNEPAENDPIMEMKQANAEFIVRACNAHDDLLEACEALVAKAKDVVYAPNKKRQFWGAPVELWGDLETAIAKAKGSPP